MQWVRTSCRHPVPLGASAWPGLLMSSTGRELKAGMPWHKLCACSGGHGMLTPWSRRGAPDFLSWVTQCPVVTVRVGCTLSQMWAPARQYGGAGGGMAAAGPSAADLWSHLSRGKRRMTAKEWVLVRTWVSARRCGSTGWRWARRPPAPPPADAVHGLPRGNVYQQCSAEEAGRCGGGGHQPGDAAALAGGG